MIITNKYNLPSAVFNVIAKDNYNRGDNNYSVTELIESPRVVQLKRRHWEELTEDASDRIWSIFGSAVHNIMESHASDDSFVEERYYLERFNRVVGGMLDCFNNGVITDYKVTSAWSIVYGSRTTHWTQQLNCYAHLLRENGHDVTNLQIVAFLRDWDKNKAKADYTYPQMPLLIIPIQLWESDVAESFITDRLALHIGAEQMTDYELFECSPEDCWEQPTKYAVMKTGRKSAVRVYDSQEEADTCLATGAGDYIQIRVGKRTRCEDYCPVSGFCSQFKAYKEAQANA